MIRARNLMLLKSTKYAFSYALKKLQIRFFFFFLLKIVMNTNILLNYGERRGRLE